MERPVLSNSKGVTLVEMMVALVILLFVSLALMQTSLMSMRTNLQNALRDEAVNIADMRINQLQSLPFPDPPATNALTATVNTPETPIQRNLRGFTATYTPTRTVADINATTKQITISVAWVYRGQTFTHAMTTILRDQ
jgi:prepilin-type N-terminal cleavage/methylation domain-containing protein